MLLKCFNVEIKQSVIFMSVSSQIELQLINLLEILSTFPTPCATDIKVTTAILYMIQKKM